MALYELGDTHLSLGRTSPWMCSAAAGRGMWTSAGGLCPGGAGGHGGGVRRHFLGDEPGAGPGGLCFSGRPAGRKILLKGNHDYWWNTAAKMHAFFTENGFTTLHLLHNNCQLYGDLALCGTRGWFYEETGDQKVFNRELIRLEASLKAAGSGRSCAFSTTRPSNRATAVRRSSISWSATA